MLTADQYAALHATVSAQPQRDRRDCDLDALREYCRAQASAAIANAKPTIPAELAAYLATMPPMQAGRARKALLRTVSADGVAVPRHALVADKVRHGWRVHGDRLASVNGTYLDKRAVTSHGLAYATMLTS